MNHRTFACVCLTLVGTAAGPPPSHGQRAVPLYVAVTANGEGAAASIDLDELSRRARAVAADRPEVVVLIHGFNTPRASGEAEYRHLARLTQQEGAAIHAGPLFIVGLHWPSYPGPLSSWLPRMIAFRATAELGMGRAVRNPYADKAALASRVGRAALRSVLFRLGDALPTSRIHVFAHSMGSEVLVRALSPGAPAVEPPPTVEQSGREATVSIAALAGADLDEDVFCRDADPFPRHALPQARVWWFTVAREGRADAGLELRSGAGRRDAIGNQGLRLERPDAEALLARGGLVLDDDHIPLNHAFTDYYRASRVKELVASIAYLRDPLNAAGRLSTLAALNPAVGRLPHCQATRKVYHMWREQPQAHGFGRLRIEGRRPRGADEAR